MFDSRFQSLIFEFAFPVQRERIVSVLFNFTNHTIGRFLEVFQFFNATLQFFVLFQKRIQSFGFIGCLRLLGCGYFFFLGGLAFQSQLAPNLLGLRIGRQGIFSVRSLDGIEEASGDEKVFKGFDTSCPTGYARPDREGVFVGLRVVRVEAGPVCSDGLTEKRQFLADQIGQGIGGRRRDDRDVGGAQGALENGLRRDQCRRRVVVSIMRGDSDDIVPAIRIANQFEKMPGFCMGVDKPEFRADRSAVDDDTEFIGNLLYEARNRRVERRIFPPPDAGGAHTKAYPVIGLSNHDFRRPKTVRYFSVPVM